MKSLVQSYKNYVWNDFELGMIFIYAFYFKTIEVTKKTLIQFS